MATTAKKQSVGAKPVRASRVRQTPEIPPHMVPVLLAASKLAAEDYKAGLCVKADDFFEQLAAERAAARA
jgi:hypothetical protein